MSLIASDGLEYKDITARLLGNPLENRRNYELRRLQEAGYCAEEVRAWYIAYDKARGGHPGKHDAGWWAIDKHRTAANRAATRSPIRTRLPNPVPAPAAAVHTAD